MLYETLSQFNIFITMFLCGFLSGFILNFKNFFLKLFKNNKILNHIFMFLTIILMFFCYFFANLFINYGQIRLFSVTTFLLAILLQNIIMNNFVAKIILKCYNKRNERAKQKKET